MSENPAMPQMLNAQWVEKATPERFAGQTVAVTGAASGIGRAVAVRVVAEGGRVIAVDLAEEDAAQRVVAACDGRVDALVQEPGLRPAPASSGPAGWCPAR